jgi:hypothetical protein
VSVGFWTVTKSPQRSKDEPVAVELQSNDTLLKLSEFKLFALSQFFSVSRRVLPVSKGLLFLFRSQPGRSHVMVGETPATTDGANSINLISVASLHFVQHRCMT